MVNGWSWYPRFQSYLITDQTSLFLHNGTNNGRRCVVSWSFRQTLSSVPPWQRRNLGDCREILRRSTFWATTHLLQYFKEYLKFFATFQNLYLFIPQFLAELWLEKKCVLYAESRASVFIWKIFDSSGWMGSIRTCRLFLASPAFSAPLRAENVIKGIGAFVIY